jgi:class 3 adenylate cyclase
LHCSARIIKDESGEVTAYDGDRVMAIFIGSDSCDRAARSALKINNARIEVINPALKRQYPDTTYQLSHVVGLDKCNLFVARTGVRGANDLVWVGKAANHAAKLCILPDYQTWITAEVFNELSAACRTGADGTSMWEQRHWTNMNRIVYRSNWMWQC